MNSSMECSMKGERIDQAMKNSKWAKFLYNFILYSLTSWIIFFFFSYLFWFPSINHFLISLPNHISFLHNAKCFFIMGNLIIFALIGESKLKRFSHSSSVSPSYIYDDYVATSGSEYNKILSKEINGFMKSPNIEEKRLGNEKKLYHEEKKKEMRVSKSSRTHGEKKKEMTVCIGEVWGESEIVKREKTKGEKEEHVYIPREDLTQRVEVFIARVNKQRLLEAKLVDHCIRG